MELTKKEVAMLKGAAILGMLSLHLFCRKEVSGLYDVFPTIHHVPLVYYLGLFGDVCVPIFCFASGYGLYASYQSNEKKLQGKPMFQRILKLLINFWVILLLFIVLGYVMNNPTLTEGGFKAFLLNASLLSNSYNGAWWFLQTYVLLVLTASFLFRWVQRTSPRTVISVLLLVYIVSYIQRIKQVVILDNEWVWIVTNAIVLYGTSLLPFLVGALFYKEKYYSRFVSWAMKLPFKNALAGCAIVGLIVLHAFIESLFIAPFIAIVFICCFSFIKKPAFIQRAFHYLGDHSTNIWLVHMFLYGSFFTELVFAPKYPVLILAWLVLLSLACSYAVKWIVTPIQRFVTQQKQSVTKAVQQ
ncbi:acyltransferase 3 [Fictibacillus macauensis ZFHKF-1]|uniref:Acyltransferase 3 n=1 Tax=Fictibacillus macauensis ZFHKF-1 TaxID=1196324 RepID=I8UIA0_9BACL|nr:acyltransferase [Fictibacillus macauensis]EIT86543.1 acyltransferase 3 [Fictibacillus macauensis ZFHKF-1]